MLWALLTAALVGGLASAALTRLAMGLAPRLRFLDRPGSEAHKQQARVVPYGGGPAMAVALALCLGTAWFVFTSRPVVVDGLLDRGPLWPVLAGAAVLLVLGAIDDRRAMRARPKLVVQLLVCAGAVWWGDLAIDSLRPWPVLAYGIAWGWLVVVTNAFNLLDHADGMSASCAVVSCAVLLSGSLLQGDAALALLWVGLIAVLAGYLWWNRPPARVYMGDAGSLPLGFLVGVGTLSVTFWPQDEGGSVLALATPFLITAIPIFDTAVVVVKRLRRGRPIMQGDRNHISHRLGRLGLSPAATLATVVALHTSLAVGALQLRTGSTVGGVLVLLQCAAVLLAVLLLETSRDHGPGLSMDVDELARLRRATDLLHGGLLVALVALRPLVWDGDPSSPANLIYLALILIALLALGVETLAGGRRVLRWSWTGLAFAGLVLALIPAALRAPIPPDGAAWWWQLVLHLALGGYLMQAIPGRERIAWSALVASVGAEVAIGWVQGLYVLPKMAATSGDDLGVAAEGVAVGDLTDRITRGGWFGTFTLSNTCAAWLLVAAAPVLGIARRSWPAALLGIAAIGLFLATRSKGALVAVAAAAGLWWMVRQTGWRRWLPIPAAALGCLALLAPSVHDGLAASARVRLGYWSGAVELVRERPWIGHGWGAFAERASGVLPLWAEPSRLVHDEPLELAVVAGLPLAALLTILLAAIARPRRCDDGSLPDGPRPHASAAVGLALLTAYGCLLGMLDGNLGWWPGGSGPLGQGMWGLLLGLALAVAVVAAGRLPLPPRWWLRLGLAALAIHCLVDFNLHSFAVVGTLLIVAVLAGGPARELPVGRAAGALLLGVTALLAAGSLRWAAAALELRAADDLVRSLRLVVDPAHAEDGFAQVAFAMDADLPPAGDRRGRTALLLAAVEAGWTRSEADPSIRLKLLGFLPPSADRLARLDGLRLRLPWSAGVARLRADDLAAAGRWPEAVEEMRRGVALAPANLPTRQDLEALLDRAIRAQPAEAERWRAERAKAGEERAALAPIVDFRNRAR